MLFPMSLCGGVGGSFQENLPASFPSHPHLHLSLSKDHLPSVLSLSRQNDPFTTCHIPFFLSSKQLPSPYRGSKTLRHPSHCLSPSLTTLSFASSALVTDLALPGIFQRPLCSFLHLPVLPAGNWEVRLQFSSSCKHHLLIETQPGHLLPAAVSPPTSLATLFLLNPARFFFFSTIQITFEQCDFLLSLCVCGGGALSH